MNLIAKNNNPIIRIYKETSAEPKTVMSQEKRKICFVLMPFSDNMKEVYDKAIKPACDKAGFDSLRVDELKGAFNINRKIIEYIFNSDAIIADLTKWNPNVFYEMGVAHAIGNKTIMIIQKKTKLPFDVSNYQCIMYSQTEAGLTELMGKIADSLLDIDEWRKYATNPVQEFKPREVFVPKSDFIALQNELIKNQERISMLQQELDDNVFLKIFMDDISISPLLGHIRYRKKGGYMKNPVELEHFGLSWKVVKNDRRHDVYITYKIKGKSLSDDTLSGLYLAVAGDNPVPISKLNPRVYHLHSDPEKRIVVKPDLLGSDGILKVLFLPFLSPGIERNGIFDIELNLKWPNLVYSEFHKDYLFLDNFDFEKGTHELQMELEFEGIEIGAVNAFIVDSSLRERRLGVIPADEKVPSKYVFRTINPENEKFFILVFEILKIS